MQASLKKYKSRIENRVLKTKATLNKIIKL